MADTYYIDIAQETPSPEAFFLFPRVYATARNNAHPAADLLECDCQLTTLATSWEFLFATFSSIITTAYSIQHEIRFADRNDSQKGLLRIHSDDPVGINTSLKDGIFSFVLDPPPALMLFCCILLGCSISSYCFRRQEHDRFQNFIFMLALVGATGLGIFIGVNPNLIMLGVIPWTCWFSMVSSTAVHWVVRRCNRRTKLGACRFGEKAVPIQQEAPAP